MLPILAKKLILQKSKFFMTCITTGGQITKNIGMLCMQKLFFKGGGVDYLKNCKWSTFLQKERRVLTRKKQKCRINSLTGILW